jgi:PAS domain S-box-containing protein
MQHFHRLLQRQINKHVPENLVEIPELKAFFGSIDQAYRDFDHDHDQIERTLEISSNELFKSNKLLNSMNEALEVKVAERTKELEEAYKVLLFEKSEREKREAIQIYTDGLLHTSNEAISTLITQSDLDSGITKAFEAVAIQGQVEAVYLFNRGLDESSIRLFKHYTSWADRLSIYSDDCCEWVLHLINQPKSGLYADLKKGMAVHSSSVVANGEFHEGMNKELLNEVDFIALPVFIGQKFSAVTLFIKKKTLIWEPVHETIMLNLSNAIGNLLHQKDIERKMNKQREALLEAQKFAKIASFTIDFKSRVSSFTEQAHELLNLTSKELEFDSELIHRLRKNVHPDDLAQIDKTWVYSMKARKEVRLDFRVIKADNSLIYLNWNVDPEFDEKGQILNVKGTLQDITDRKVLEEKAATARLIIENSPAILFRWSIAENWPVEYVSSNIRQFGYSEKDFLSQRLNYADIIHDDDVNRILNEVESYKAENRKSYTQEYRILTSTGEVRWVEDQTVIEEDSNGVVLFHQGIINDITEQKIIKFALEESEQRFRSLVQNSSDITTIMELDGTIRYEPAEIVGRSAFEFIHPEDVENVLSSFAELKNTSEIPAPIVFRFRHKSGAWQYLEAIGNDLSNEPAIAGLVVNSRDVTERVANEQQLKEYAGSLEKINKELDQFAYIVSHDLKAPLRAINNLSIWIEEDLEGKMEADTMKNFDMLRGRIHRMEALINGILQYSRAGRMKAESVPIPMNAFIADIIANLSPPENFTVHVQEDLPVIEGEKVAIDQVFSNFISNAIKYNSNPNPTIKIGYEDRGIVHCFYVQDNGPGIEKQFHEKVFAIFQTLQARDTIESTGVGLAIVKKIIEEKGGNVWLESELGQGSTFFFTIPKSEKMA